MEYGNLIWLVLALITSFLISYVSMPVIIQIAGLKKLMDEPDEDRKLHSGVIPTLGGIGIFSAFLISFSIWGDASQLSSYPFFVAALFMLFLVGIKDDILVISPNKKLIVQLAVALEIVLGGQIYLENFNGLFGIYELPWLVAVGLSIFVFVALINSYNLIDGIDGLAGGIGIVISSIFGIWFWGAGFYTLGIMSFVLAGAMLGFLMYNMHPAKIFMGDTGAMAVGFIMAFLALQFIRLNSTVAGTEWHIENAAVFAVAILIIPIIDTLRVFSIRLLTGQTPFKADHNHTHHKLLEMNIPQHYASFLLWSANFLIIAFAFYFQSMGPNILLAGVLMLGFLILPVTRFVSTQVFGLSSRKKWEPTLQFSTSHYSKKRNGRGEGKRKRQEFSGKLEEHFFGE